MIPISKPFIGDAEKQAVLQVFESGMLVQGPRVAQLEEKFALICGVRHAVATSSGTTALHTALLAHGIGPGDDVITTPFTFFASVSSILYTGATPVFVDIEEDTYNLNPRLIEAAVTSRTKAILPVHIYGHPCEMDVIQEIAEKHALIIIEDACQAVGAELRGQRVGSFGTGCFSLYATKNIMAGEGGMITTNDDKLAERCRMIRNHGMQRRYYHDRRGYNFRMSDLRAAMGLAKIDQFEAFTDRRQANASYLSSHITRVITPKVRAGYRHVWHQYTVRAPGKDRDHVLKQLAEAGVGTGVFYPLPAYRQQPIIELGGPHIFLPVTEQVCQEVFSLPVHPQLSQADLDTIVSAVNQL